MSQPFTFTSPQDLVDQPAGAGEKMIFRSDDAADTGNLSLTGLVAAVSTTNTAALTGKREKETSGTFTSLTIAALSAAQAGIVSVYGQGTKAVGYVIFTTQPANDDTVLIGLTGFLQTYTFKTTLTGAANEVLRGADATASALNLKKAINNEGTAGTHYGTGTVANAYASAGVSGTIVTLTDRIAIARLLAWSVTQTVGTTLSLLAPIGGITGTLLATLAVGTTGAYTSFTLDTEDLTTDTLPAGFTGYSDVLAINGSKAELRLKSDAPNVIDVAYETSTDGTNWAGGTTSITDVDDSYTVLDPQHVYPAEFIDYLRLHISANANTVDVPFDARAIS